MSFLEEYFINPILANGWFNPVNTLVYSIILIIAVYLVFRLLRRMKIRIDANFGASLLPFIVWASSTRVLHDSAVSGVLPPGVNEFYSAPFFPTPGSYLITFALALITLLASLGLQKYKGIPYHRPMTAFGVFYCTINFILLPRLDPYPFFLIFGITGAWAVLFSAPQLIKRAPEKLKSLFSWENNFILSAHFLDATATVVSLTMFGYMEQHVVPRLFFPFMGPHAMFFLKAAVVIPVLWLLDRYKDEEPEFINFLKIVVLILGLAPGLRDTIRLMAGV